MSVLGWCVARLGLNGEAMDFLQTFSKTNIFLSRILEIYIIKG